MKQKLLILLTLFLTLRISKIIANKERKLPESPIATQTLSNPQYAHWNPNAHTTKFNPQIKEHVESEPTQFGALGLSENHMVNSMANPMLNPMLMNPYSMGAGVMGMLPGTGMVMPGMAMYPFMNPYLGTYGPYGSNSPYNDQSESF